MFRRGLLLGVVVVLSRVVGALMAQEPAPQAGRVLVLPELTASFDVDSASALLRDQDSAALCVVAARLGEAERRLGLTNPVSAVMVYRAAIQSAADKQDPDALRTVEQAIRSSGLGESDRSSLLTFAELLRGLASAPRKLDVGPGLKPRDVSPESVAIYQAFLREIRVARQFGLMEDVAPLANALEEIRELHPKQRDHLQKLLEEAQVVIRERGMGDSLIPKLAMTSRSIEGGTGDVRVLGPDALEKNVPATLVVIPVTKRGSEPGRLHLKVTSGRLKTAGTDVSTLDGSREWNGKVQVIRVVSTEPGTASLALGLDAKVPACRWFAIVR